MIETAPEIQATVRCTATPCVYQLHDVQFAYPQLPATLQNISLHIPAGQKTVLLGANGCGKSTLLKLLDGLIFPTEGTIKAFGVELTEDLLEDEAWSFAFRRRVSLVFQDPDVQLFSPTVREEVAFGPLQLGLSKAEVEQRVGDALELLGITKLADRAPHQLSGGEKKKVALATVVAVKPEVLLMDEPTAALDPRSKRNLVEFMLKEAEQGCTLVIATHDLDIVSTIADYCFVIDEDHRLAAEGTPAAILRNRELLLRCNLIHESEHLPEFDLPHGGAEEHAHIYLHSHS